MYRIIYSKAAVQAIPLLKSAKLDTRAKALIALIEQNPFQNPPPYEKLVGNYKGAYSRRINHQPVSYTHLDVYKRQVYNSQHFPFSPPLLFTTMNNILYTLYITHISLSIAFLFRMLYIYLGGVFLDKIQLGCPFG